MTQKETKTIAGIIDFFTGERGEGDETPCHLPKSGPEKAPYYLDHTANLDSLRYLPFSDPTSCNPKYIVLQCSCNRQIVLSSCMSLDCTTCRDYVIKRRSNSVFHRLIRPIPGQRLRLNRKTVVYTAFTVPLEVRERYLNRKAWSMLRRRVWRLLKDDFGGLYGMEASHPVGDEDVHLFHPHLNFLWTQRNGYRPFLDVELLRKKWATLLGVDTVDVHTEYSDNVRKIKHWCNYVCRTFPGNHCWTGPIRWYGKYPRNTEKIEVVCAECGCKFRRVGAISKALVDEYYRVGFMNGIDPPWENDKLIGWRG